MHPKLISIGSFYIPTYGVLVALGFLAGLWMTMRLARRTGVNPERAMSLAIYCAIAGVVGAKLLSFVLDFGYYSLHPSEMFSLSTLQAGGVFSGGLILAVIVAWYYTRKHKMPGLETTDAFAPGIALGHAIGRLGCFSAGCCFGVLCDKPWAVTFTNPFVHQMFDTPIHLPLHPTQLYEAFAEAVIFVVLLLQFRKAHKPGWAIGWYLVLYSAARFWIEFYRAHEQALIGPFSATQWIALAMLGAGIWLVARAQGEGRVTAPAA